MVLILRLRLSDTWGESSIATYAKKVLQFASQKLTIAKQIVKLFFSQSLYFLLFITFNSIVLPGFTQRFQIKNNFYRSFPIITKELVTSLLSKATPRPGISPGISLQGNFGRNQLLKGSTPPGPLRPSPTIDLHLFSNPSVFQSLPKVLQSFREYFLSVGNAAI